MRNIFNSEAELLREYGKDNATAIKKRMAILNAAPTLENVPSEKPTRRHPLKGDRKGEFAVDLCHPFRLVFEPDHDPIPLKKDGGIDLSEITAVIILRVEDYH